MAAYTFGQYLTDQRTSVNLEVPALAEKLGVSAEYLLALERDLRLPSAKLLEKFGSEIELTISNADSPSGRTPKFIRRWVNRHPVLRRALRLFKSEPTSTKVPAQAEKTPRLRDSRRYPIAIYESELQAIALESSSWDKETGGDLFGIWGEIPIVYLATKAGPNSVRDQAHFRLDVEYLVELSVELDQDWGLRYFGDWHSHHRLGLSTPSRGDRDRIRRVARKNDFAEMAEFIVTFSSTHSSDRTIQINPYAYLQLPTADITDIDLIVFEGVSPVRENLAVANVRSEQDFASSANFSLGDIVIPEEPLPRLNGHSGPALRPITDTVIRRAARILEAASFKQVETHDTAFGYVIVVPISSNDHLGIAIDAAWPHKVLQVNWINRESGETEELELSFNSASLSNPDSLLHLIDKARNSEQRS